MHPSSHAGRVGATMSRLLDQIGREVSHFDTQDWLLAMIAAVVVGYFALRGFSLR